MTQLKLCLNCNNVIPRTLRPGTKWKISITDYLSRKFCCDKCRLSYRSKEITGINNPNWKGGNRKCIDCGNTLTYRRKGTKRCWDCYAKTASGETNNNYKGDKPLNYIYLHRFIREKYGNPRKCQHCGRIGNNRQIQWANKSGKYLRDRSDWLALCCRCHRIYDAER